MSTATMLSLPATGADAWTIEGIALETLRRGAGRPILLLHGPDPLPPEAPVLDALARFGRVIAPSLPGFGASPRPDGFETIFDLAQLTAAMLEALGEPAVLIGCSFGGWIAAEAALACPHRIAKLVLVDALGIRVSDDPLTRDIMDFFNTHPREVARRSWHDPAHAPDYDAMSDAALIRHARSRDALCLYGWDPHMYNPRLRAWLHRIAAPTLLAWGASDRVVTPEYGRAYAGAIPGATFVTIPEAGHHPEREQPAAFAAAIADFLQS
ncbi:MAG: alpha/beta hydrolase [Rhodospirillales bacterium]|nr:alpha/beta hydrolase [Rhodospirillales bacterium]